MVDSTTPRTRIRGSGIGASGSQGWHWLRPAPPPSLVPRAPAHARSWNQPSTCCSPRSLTPSDKPAIRFPERTLSYRSLRDAAAAVAARVEGAERVAVWATPAPETCVGVIGALLAGVPAVPINPKSGARELAHIVSDSAPELVLTRAWRRPARGRGDAAAGRRRPRRPRELPLARARRRGAGARRLHVGHHRPAQGRGAAPAGHRLEPRRARVGVGVDGGRRGRARAAAVPRPWARSSGSSGPSVAAARRGTSALLVGRGRGGLRGRRDRALRRADDVPPARPGRAEDDGRVADALGRARLLVSGSAALPGRRARAHRAPDRAAGRGALRDDRDAHEHVDPGLRRAPAGLRGPAVGGRRAAPRRRRRPRRWRRATTRPSARSRCAGPTSSSST